MCTVVVFRTEEATRRDGNNGAIPQGNTWIWAFKKYETRNISTKLFDKGQDEKGPLKALWRHYEGIMKAIWRHYEGIMKALWSSDYEAGHQSQRKKDDEGLKLW